MSNRKIRVGELVRREVSDILHTRFQTQAVLLTITHVDVSPDNKNALVFYSVIETEADSLRVAQQFFDKHRAYFKRELAKRIVLKSLPDLKFQFDEANQQGARINDLIDELAIPEETSEGPDRQGEER